MFRRRVTVVYPNHRFINYFSCVTGWARRGDLAGARKSLGNFARYSSVPPEERFVFWKAGFRDHTVENPHHPLDIDAYPEGYAYVASEWLADDMGSSPIIVLERHH
jgi:hypothetical protein